MALGNPSDDFLELSGVSWEVRNRFWRGWAPPEEIPKYSKIGLGGLLGVPWAVRDGPGALRARFLMFAGSPGALPDGFLFRILARLWIYSS